MYTTGRLLRVFWFIPCIPVISLVCVPLTINLTTIIILATTITACDHLLVTSYYLLLPIIYCTSSLLPTSSITYYHDYILPLLPATTTTTCYQYYLLLLLVQLNDLNVDGCTICNRQTVWNPLRTSVRNELYTCGHQWYGMVPAIERCIHIYYVYIVQ